MEKKKWGKALSHAAYALAEPALAFAVARLRGLDFSKSVQLNARYLSDGFFVIGLLATGLGLLIWVSTTGFFDIMGYAVKSVVVLFSSLKKPKDHISFYDYKQIKNENRGKPLHALLLSGVACILLSLVCLVVYYR